MVQGEPDSKYAGNDQGTPAPYAPSAPLLFDGALQGHPPVQAATPPPNHHFPPHAPQYPADISYQLLNNVPQIYIRQKLDWAEMLVEGLEIPNRYHMYLSQADQDEKRLWMDATEESKCCHRIWWQPRHKLTMNVSFPKGGPTILKGERPCIWCLHRMTVTEARTGQVLGSFEQDCKDLWGCCPSTTHVKDAEGNLMYDMQGPAPCKLYWCMSCPCRDPMEFKQVVQGTPTGANVQNIPNGWLKMCCSNADDYILSFGEKSSAEERAMLLMYTFLLDYQFFQAKKKNNNNSMS